MLALLRLGGNRFHSPTHFFNPVLRRTFMIMAPRFIPSCLDAVEDIDGYQPGSHHSISIGDTFDHGHFRVLHKLGFRGSFTVRLARDQRQEGDQSRFVALKAIRANVSTSKVPSGIPEAAVSQKLRASFPPSESVDYSSYFPLPVPVFLPCLTHPGRLLAVGDTCTAPASLMEVSKSSASFSAMSVAGE